MTSRATKLAKVLLWLNLFRLAQVRESITATSQESRKTAKLCRECKVSFCSANSSKIRKDWHRAARWFFALEKYCV
jgi:hypothetical protein